MFNYYFIKNYSILAYFYLRLSYSAPVFIVSFNILTAAKYVVFPSIDFCIPLEVLN